VCVAKIVLWTALQFWSVRAIEASVVPATMSLRRRGNSLVAPAVFVEGAPVRDHVLGERLDAGQNGVRPG
jgi:hypothetical protein